MCADTGAACGCLKSSRPMNVLFVIPPAPGKKKVMRLIDCSHEAKANYLWQPNDFMIISGLLGLDDSAQLIDGTAEALEEAGFMARVRGASKPDMIFFALSSVCWKTDLDYYQKVRLILPGAASYVIGDIFTYEVYQSFILKQCDGIIFNPFLLNLAAMAAKQSELPGVCTTAGTVFFPEGGTGATVVHSGTPRHELFESSAYTFPFAHHLRMATVTTMWGCPFTCSYCPDSKIPPMVRPPQDVIAELQHVWDMGVRELFFWDKTFGYPRQNAMEILKELAARFHFSWSCYLNPSLYKPELLDAMHLAGCHTIIIGIDTENLASLAQYKRGMKKEVLDALLEHADRLRVSVCADFIIGLPHEDEHDIRRTLRYALGIPLDFASFNIAAPLPGSQLCDEAFRDGRLKFGDEGFDTLAAKCVLGNPKVTPGRIMELRRQAVLRFYLRPSYILRRLSRTVSLEHFWIQFREMFALFRKN